MLVAGGYCTLIHTIIEGQLITFSSLSLSPSLSPGMSQYVANTRDKISSATMMLALSEQDMEKKLGISNPLHRRKLKLALDYQKSPEE